MGATDEQLRTAIVARQGEARALEGAYEQPAEDEHPALLPPPIQWRAVVVIMLLDFVFYTGAASTFSPGVLLLRELACERLGIEQGDECSQSVEAESVAAGWGTVFSFTGGSIGMIVAPLFTMATDRFGRKPVLALIPCVNVVQGVLVQLVLGPLPERALGIDRIWWYFAVVSLGAVSGGLFPFINCGFAAVADLTKDQIASSRATVFGIVQVSIFVGLTVGPIVGGLIADRVSVRLSLIFSACCSALQVPLTLLLFHETLEPARRTAWEWKRANPFGSLHLLFQSRVTLLLGLIMLCQLFASTGGGTLLTLYLQTTFGWGPATLGYSQTVTYAANAVGLMVCLPLLQRCVGTKLVLLLSCISGTIYLVAQGMVGCVPFERCELEVAQRHEWQMWLVLSLGVLNAMYFPGIRTSICGLAGEGNYGKALGAVACTQQLVSVFAGPAFFYLQGRTSEGCTGRGCFLTELRGISFMFAAGISLLSVMAAIALPTLAMRQLDSATTTTSSRRSSSDDNNHHHSAKTSTGSRSGSSSGSGVLLVSGGVGHHHAVRRNSVNAVESSFSSLSNNAAVIQAVTPGRPDNPLTVTAAMQEQQQEPSALTLGPGPLPPTAPLPCCLS